MSDKIVIGVSACLLGENVRYDGGHKLDRFIRDTLGQFVDFVSVCPEMACGLSVPREAMHLEGDPMAPRLMTIRTHRDITFQMTTWGQKRLDELAAENLCGYIFKSKSPSSGMRGIKVYNENGIPHKTGVGIWARMFMERFPYVPVEDEGRLNDPDIREQFIERIFVYGRWREYLQNDGSTGGLVAFHTAHKLMFMAHSPQLYRETGMLVASTKNMDRAALRASYLSLLTKTFCLRTTVKKNVNVLQHCAGYFKKQLAPEEKRELTGIIGAYAAGFYPLIVPVTILNHYVAKYDQLYLKQQWYLNPHPIELKLRNHA